MKLKKANAAIGLTLIILMIIHVLYTAWSYKVLYYNPLITDILGYSTAAAVVIHVILSIISVTHKHDGSTLSMYLKDNAGTILQRVSGVTMILLLPVHIKTGDLIMQHIVGLTGFALLVVCEILFWLMIGIHITMSFSRALITFGVLEDMKKKKMIDIACGIISAAVLITAGYIVVMTQAYLFFNA